MTITIVGAGLTGPLMGLYLARKNYALDIFEHRPDMRKADISAGRSINLALSTRGLHALQEMGISSNILEEAIPMKGRMIHPLAGPLKFQPYGRNESDYLMSIGRGALNKALLTAVESYPGVRLHFQEKAADVDFEKGQLFLEHQATGQKRQVPFDLLLGTDGGASLIRSKMMTQLERDDLTHGYKELCIPPGKNGEFLMEREALHIWPRKSFMLIALPNPDGSFTCTLFLENTSFATLRSPEEILTFFRAEFPDVVPLMPTLVHDFLENPTGHLHTIKCFPWSYQDRALLLGDAAHAIVPFYGQGMNCCFEDCSVLNRILDQEPPSSWKKVFERFQEERKKNTDAIAEMAVANFVEMRDLTGNPQFLLRKQVEQFLMNTYPGLYQSQYFLVTFTRVPYSYAQQVGRYQEEFLLGLCREIKDISDLDKSKVDQSMEGYREWVEKLNGKFFLS